MKASLCYYLIVLSCSLALALPCVAQAGQYTVQLDSMTAQDAAEGKVQQLKAQGLNAYWLKSNIPGQGLRFRVRIGRFATRAAAQAYGTKLKQQGLTTDFFAALYEGNSSPLGNEQAVKKVAPAPVVVAKPVPVAQPPQPKVEEKNSLTAAPAQRKREVNTTPATSNSIVEKPVVNPSANADGTRKPVIVPPTVAPKVVPPSNNAAPKSVPPVEVKPIKMTPTQTTPALPTPLNEVKPPRDKKAENIMPAETKKTEPLSNKIADATLPKPMRETVAAATTPAPTVVTYTKFEDRTFGYSFERPGYWSGGNLPAEDLQAQRIDSGAIFRSQEDAAFSHAIWNSLKNANSPAYDNNLIVDLVIKSIGNSEGMQGLTETARRMAQEGDQIKTFVDLRTMFRQPRVNSLLEFQGKAVIIRASTGILLVVAFYSKDSAPTMMGVADKIISSARVP